MKNKIRDPIKIIIPIARPSSVSILNIYII